MMNTHKYIARITIEADSPFAIGSGEKGITVDRLIARDAMGLPYIPGTGLAGVLRHELDPADNSLEIRKLFGFQEKTGVGQGSRLAISSAHLLGLGADGITVMEGMFPVETLHAEYYRYFQKLPERDHVRINDRGAVDGSGKFDEELVHKGTRFVFSMELSGNEEDSDHWNKLLTTLHQPFFRIGAGTRKGFGKLKIHSCKTRIFNLTNEHDLLSYLELSSSLNAELIECKLFESTPSTLNNWIHYQLKLTPENFFLFAAGYGDEEVDNKPKTEKYFEWSTGRPVLSEKDWLLIPATSVKGALSHRVAFHYNKLTNNYINPSQTSFSVPSVDIDRVFKSFPLPIDIDSIDMPSNDPRWTEYQSKIDEWSFEEVLNNSEEWDEYIDELIKYQANYEASEKPIQENNEAVKILFGYALDTDDSGARGNVLITDLYLDPASKPTKVFSHVAIDRFTGGARDGMLFQQKVASSKEFTLDIYVKKDILKDNIKIAFEKALHDLCEGNLQLGGGTTKGHGVFTGSWQTIND